MITPYIPSASTAPTHIGSSFLSYEKNDQFITSLIHEIRNPLSTIKLAIEILKNTSTDFSQKQYIEMIVKSNDRINEIITQLLLSLRQDMVVLKQYPAHELIEEVLKENEDRFLLSHIKITRNYTRLASSILANKEEIKIALTNIIINAVEALPEYGGELIFTIKCDDGICTLIIQDNGTGIEKELLNNLFKPYHTTKPSGIGLGLSVTLSMLALNSVTVKVQSEIGIGTRFILSFKNRPVKIY